jgi:hypothetical protein
MPGIDITTDTAMIYTDANCEQDPQGAYQERTIPPLGFRVEDLSLLAAMQCSTWLR